MKERPILFNSLMVQAILSDDKTQTRRAVKPHITEAAEYMDDDVEDFATFQRYIPVNDDKTTQPEQWGVYCSEYPEEGSWPIGQCPYGLVGDQLWVRETFRYYNSVDECGCSDQPCNCPDHNAVIYRATSGGDGPWKPSIFMPRKASRIQLEIVEIRIEPLHDLSEPDANAEGIQTWIESFNKSGRYHQNGQLRMYPVTAFARLWNSINGKTINAWSKKPWVWVVRFKRIN